MKEVETFTHETHPDRIPEGKRIRLVYDEQYETRGTWALDTEEETKAAEDEEIENLESGNWIVLGRICERQCSCCGSWVTDESDFDCWGIVVENSTEGLIDAAFNV